MMVLRKFKDHCFLSCNLGSAKAGSFGVVPKYNKITVSQSESKERRKAYDTQSNRLR